MATVMICEDSLEGIFTAIYEVYEYKRKPEEIILQIGEEDDLRLFCDYEEIIPDAIKTKKVVNTIVREFGLDCYSAICRCLATQEHDKAQAVFQTIVTGLGMQNKKEVMGNLANDSIRHVFEWSRRANNEILHLQGFLRFQELEKGILFARIGPKNNIITFLAPHFSDRFPLENFMIYDEVRKFFVIHPAKKEWTLVTQEELNEDMIKNLSSKEKEYQELFSCFCHKIAIKERENSHLQRQMLPLRFRQYMTEFVQKR